MGAQCLVLVFSTLCPSSFAIILVGKKRAGCFDLTVFLMYCDSQCSVAPPRGAEGWSAVCDCGISRSYSLAFLVFLPCILKMYRKRQLNL